MSSHFCRVGKIIPNLSKLIGTKELEKLENRFVKFVDDSENKSSDNFLKAT